jgi:hypothetical protein
MKRFFSAALALTALLVFGVARPAPAPAQLIPRAHCFGQAAVYAGDSLSSVPNRIIDFGEVASYATQIGHNKDCEDKVSAAAALDSNFNNKTWLCQQIQHQGQYRVTAYAKVGTLNWSVAQSIFVTCSGGVTTCTCPVGWSGDNPSITGGVTTNGRCAKAACQHGIQPSPPNDTKIGTWGFTWGNGFYAYGSTANGGAAHCVTTPWVGV